MDVTLSQACADTETRIETQKRARAEIDAQILEDEQLLAALKMAMENYGQGAVIHGDDEVPWTMLSIVDAVLRVLDEAATALSPVDVLGELHRHAREDTYQQVSNTLVYLARLDRAHKPDRGKYVAGSKPQGSLLKEVEI